MIVTRLLRASRVHDSVQHLKMMLKPLKFTIINVTLNLCSRTSQRTETCKIEDAKSVNYFMYFCCKLSFCLHVSRCVTFFNVYKLILVNKAKIITSTQYFHPL
jgi:uncharacterized protein with PQ loop repeat